MDWFNGTSPLLKLTIILLWGYLGTKFAVFILNLVRRVVILSRIPYPKKTPFIGLLYELSKGSPWVTMHSYMKNLGPIIYLQVFSTSFVLVGNPEGAKHILQSGHRKFVKDIELSYKTFMGILGSGMVTSDGSHWQQQRLALGHVLRIDMLESVVDISHRATLRLVNKLRLLEKVDNCIEMEEEFRKLTLQIIGEAFLSLDADECDKIFPNLYLPIMTEANVRVHKFWRSYLPTPGWFENRRKLYQLNTYLQSLIKSRWHDRLGGSNKQYNDLLEKRLAGIQENGECWSSAMEEQLCYEFKTFLLAGHETSAAMLCWTLHELCNHPDELKKVLIESTDLMKCKSKFRESAQSSQFTLACLKESLRKYPIVPLITRRLTEDDVILGYKIPKGTHVACVMSAIHDFEWKDSDTWKPERFLPNGEYESFDEDLRTFKFLPFLHGPRNCLGQHFALLEARVILATLLTGLKDIIPSGPVDGLLMKFSTTS